MASNLPRSDFVLHIYPHHFKGLFRNVSGRLKQADTFGLRFNQLSGG